MTRSRPPAPASATRWLFNPAIDVLIGAGGWTIPILALTAVASTRGGIDVAFAFSILTLACNYPHYMATIHRAYVERAAFVQYRSYTLYVTTALATTLIAAHALPVLRPVIFSAYLFWSPWHYTGQNFGLALLFARRGGLCPTALDRRMLRAGFAAAYGVWLLSMQSQPSDDPYVLSLAIDSVVANGIAAALATLMLSAFLAFAVPSVRRAGLGAVAPTLVLCATQISWFVAPWVATLAGGAVAPSVYYTTGALAFMHCAQYLWITTYYTRAATMRAAGDEGWRLSNYARVLGLGGIALFIPGPWIASSLAGVDLRESMIIFTAIVNLHHFVLDGALWKLRDRRVATVLIDGRAETPRAATQSFPAVPATLGWALAAALLAVAGVDVCQRVLTRETATNRAIAVAHACNGHDTRVDVRRAALLARASRNDAAIALLRPIVATNPLHAPAQRLLGSVLLADHRWSEAADHYETLARSGVLDAIGYVNLGVLRARTHDARGAESAFRHALALDRDAADAHLNLAEALWQQDRRSDALGHYARYLDLADPRDAQSQRVYLLAALKLAEGDRQVGDDNDALTLLERTTRAADRIEAWDLAVLAHAQAAQLLERSADGQAVRMHYEHAISAAQRGGDTQREQLLRSRYASYLARETSRQSTTGLRR